MHKFVADLCIQVNELKKAKSNLSEAEHLLYNLDQEGVIEKNIIHSALACIHTQLSMVAYRDRQPMEALEELRKA